jgi:hypothetical protein
MDVTPVNSNDARRSRVFGSSVIGPMHLQGGIPCQDACAYVATSAGAIVIAVADGLGSAARSDAGASLAVSSAFSFCMTVLDTGSGEERRLEELVRDAAVHARSELELLAQKESCSLRDLACTLIVAIATGRHFAVAHIGDGAVVGEVGGLLSLISGPAESEYTNEVVPLTSREWQDSLRIASGESSIRGIAVFTDGCQRAAFRKVEDALVPFEMFFTPVFNYAREVTDPATGAMEIAELLASFKLCEHSDDDKTLVVGVIEMD